MTIKKPLDMATGAALFAVSLVLLVVCFDLPEHGADALGPRFFPFMLTVAMSVLSLIIVFQSVDMSGAKRVKSDAKTIDRDPVAARMQWAFIGALGVYIIVLPYIGYIVATFCFCFLTMLLLGPIDKKSVFVSALMSAITSIALTYIFGHILKLFLP